MRTNAEKTCNFLNSIDLSRLRLVFCEHMDDKSTLWNFEKHSHAHFEIICFLEGKTRIDFKENSIEVSTYNLIAYPPHVEHQEFFAPHCRQEVIAFGIDLHASVQLNSSFKITDRDGLFRWFFEHVHGEYSKHKTKSSQLISLYLQSIFLHMIRYFSDPHRENPDIAETVTAFLHENFDKEIGIPKLCTIASVSSSYLNRVFVNKLNTTPMRYLNDLRMEIAKKLLLSSEFSVLDIANRVGFTDSCYFWRVFKKATGVSPSEYRKHFHIASTQDDPLQG